MNAARPFVLSLSLLLCLSACGGPNVRLDNPRPDAVTFTIDGTDHAVPAGGKAEISLDPGTHQATVKGSAPEALAQASFTVKEGGILHSGMTEYIVWKQLYGEQKERATLLHEDTLTLDSTYQVFGDFQTFPKTELFIEKTWDHGLDEDFPAGDNLFITKDWAIHTKIFRSPDLVKYMREHAKR